ncbi:MAG: hypothetical protein R6T92_13875, partial [Desulfosalsimonadaceae bacterium]
PLAVELVLHLTALGDISQDRRVEGLARLVAVTLLTPYLLRVWIHNARPLSTSNNTVAGPSIFYETTHADIE